MSNLEFTSARLAGHWPFSEGAGNSVADAAGAHDLTAGGELTWTAGPVAGSSAVQGGPGFHLSTSAPIVKTDESFSIAAWLRLDSALLGPRLALQPNWFALSAVAQSGVYHSAFYLGLRNIEYGGEGTGDYHFHWNFTAAPIDGSDDGPIDWVHAYSGAELGDDDLDQWVLLVGVYDLEAGEARIYVPNRDDRGTQALPADWPKWSAEERLDVGQAWFRDEFVDQWPGSVGPIWAFQGVLTEEEARLLGGDAPTG